MWSSDAHVLAIAPRRPRALAHEIDLALRRREVVAATKPIAPAPPEPATSPEPTPAPTPPAATAVTTRAATPATTPSAATPSATTPATTRSATTEPASGSTPAPAQAELDVLLARARHELATGHLDQALATTRLAAARGATTGAWRVLAADALRGLGRAREAADAYELAARELTGSDAFEAGYSAAYLRFKELQDYDGALEALVTSRADAENSPLEERGLALHVKILVAAKRNADARPIAARYLARYPKGELRAIMEALQK